MLHPKSIIAIVGLCITLLGVRVAYASDTISQSVSDKKYDFTPYVADLPFQPIGNGFSGHVIDMEFIVPVSSDSGNVVLYECNNSVFTGGGCDSPSNAYSLAGRDFYISETVDTGWYHWTLSTSSPYISLDPDKYYVVATPLWNGSGTKGTDSHHFFQDCLTFSDDPCGDVKSIYFRLTVDGTYTGHPYNTEFIDIAPSGTEVATTSPVIFTSSLWLSEDDWSDGAYVRLKYVRQTDLQSAVACQDCLWHTIDLTDHENSLYSGYNYVSTTTNFLGLDGIYLLKAEIRKPSSWWSTTLSWVNPFSSLDPDIIVSTSTQFTYGTSTSFDKFVNNTTEAIDDLVNNSSATSTAKMVSDACNPLSLDNFSISRCLGGIFGFNIPENKTAMTNMYNGLLSHAPFGYIKRFIDIANETATTSLPAISYTFQSKSVLAGETISLNPWQYVSFTATGTPLHDIKSDVDGAEKNVWEILRPYYITVVYMLLAILIIGDIMGIVVGGSSGYMGRRNGEGSRHNRNPSAYREWLYKHK